MSKQTANTRSADARRVLKQYFGYDSFRPGQEELVNAILAGRDTVGIMPTGAGKSLCYQVPAMLLPGITLVISPLISLMKDQVGALREAGIPAAMLNSGQSAEEVAETRQLAWSGGLKLLYVAPERLLLPAFLNFACQSGISMVTVDEAHCISQWGQDFRPSYMKILDFLAELPGRPVLSAFTATATAVVRDDIIRTLELADPFVFTTSFDRPNLYFAVERPQSKMNALLRLLTARAGKSGIVYCATRKTVDDVYSTLCANGISVTRYHAGLHAEERRKNQDDFLYDQKRVMIATNAFGMGIDKSNVSFVIHYNMPKNMEGYYQEAGRAGRDGSPADCILLYSGQDVHTGQFLIQHSNESIDPSMNPETRKALLERDLERLRQMTFYATTTDCLRRFILRYFGENAPLSCGHCSNCDTSFEEMDATVDAQKILSCVYRLAERRLRFSKTTVAEILTGSASERIQKFQLNTLSTYNIMKDSSQLRVRQMVDVLVEQGYLHCDTEHYNALSLTASGNQLMRGRGTFVIRLPKEQKKTVFDTVSASVRSPANQILFERLRAVRSALAQEARVPPYVIFSDMTLSEMAERKPTSLPSMRGVHGVGEVKARRYGAFFLAEIKQYLQEE